jgi:hypothetical protein
MYKSYVLKKNIYDIYIMVAKKTSPKSQTKKTSPKSQTKKTSPKSVNSRASKIIDTIKKNPVKSALGAVAVLGAGLAVGFALKKVKDYYTKTTTLSVKINSEEEAINVIFDPKEAGLWGGDPGLSSIFLNEHLYKLPNVCDSKKYKKYRLIFAHDSSMAIADGTIATQVSTEEMVKKMEEMIRYAECSSKRFFIFPILVITLQGGHSNTLIYDSKNKTMDHFEPYGSNNLMDTLGGLSAIQSLVQNICNRLDIKYNSPNEVCPRLGFQSLEQLKCPVLRILRNNFKTKIGFCLVWSLFFIELRLKNPDVPSKDMIKKAIDNLGVNLCNFIAGYAANVVRFSKNYDLVLDPATKLVVDYKEKST